MLEEIKGYATGLLTRWILKALGGALAGIGYEGDDATLFISGIVSFVIGIGISIYQHVKAKKDAASVNPEDPSLGANVTG